MARRLTPPKHGRWPKGSRRGRWAGMPQLQFSGIKALPTVICQGCGRPLPKLLYQPITADLNLLWSAMMVIEKQLLAGLMLFHVQGNEYSTWSPMQAAVLSGLKYRQVQNSLRRLVPCGWAQRLSRGRYRLTILTVETLTPMIKGSRMTVTRLRDAQVQAQEAQ